MTGDPADARLAEQLLELEGTLWRAGTRFDRRWMEQVLHPDFHEFGRSGRRWSRDEVLQAPPVEITVAWPPQQPRVRLVAPGVALVTYVVVDAAGLAANRSSLWLADGSAHGPGSSWRLRFHQGGPTTP